MPREDHGLCLPGVHRPRPDDGARGGHGAAPRRGRRSGRPHLGFADAPAERQAARPLRDLPGAA
eukprot:97469-Heterocapsa_arctica.AAC.1